MRFSGVFAGWRGALLVATTYVYFLIFAQFAFLARLAEIGLQASMLKPVMAAMAISGVLSSFLASRLADRYRADTLVRSAFAGCAVAAVSSAAPLGWTGAVGVALLIGAGLGVLTVSLVTHLRLWCGSHQPLLAVGFGTGLGYALCNVPALFTASPRTQAIVVTALCLIGMMIAGDVRATAGADNEQPKAHTAFPLVLIAFVALIWLDSAAFYIIQHTAVLKSASWSGSGHLWRISAVHFLAAIASALLLRKQRVAAVLCCAVAALAGACYLLASPFSVPFASLLYPAGVSFYSVALVAYPAFLGSSRSVRDRARQAAWLYAVAGWIGSAMGIGMGQHLGYVPTVFILVATLAVAGPALILFVKVHFREAVLLALTALLALAVHHVMPTERDDPSNSAIERGRRVYISEGCISCHSQYVRPGTADEPMWGPTTPLSVIHAQKPPLIGNRRQGPDLAQIGTRRSPVWLRDHLIDPAALSDGSPMPSYAILFRDGRGDDLVAYLASLRSPTPENAQRVKWHLNAAVWPGASASEGAHLYQKDCATCHEPSGAARVRFGSSFSRRPPDRDEIALASQLQPPDRLAHLIRFGIAGTDMPGHEYLSDRQIASLVLWSTSPNAQFITPSQPTTGDTQ